MMLLSDIATGVGVECREQGIDLTDTAVNLDQANRIHRALGLALPWPELRRLDTSLATTSTSGVIDANYLWPTDPVFNNVLRLQMQDEEDQGRYRDIPTPVDELMWEQAEGKAAKAVPAMHQLYTAVASPNETEQIRVEFRPSPKYVGKTIRITGIIEPAVLYGESKTFFRFRAGDDAFTYMLAAALLDINGFTSFADRQLNKAGQILGQLFGRDVAPVELPTKIIRGE